MRLAFGLASVALLVSCSGGKATDTSGTDTSCHNTITPYPLADATNVYYHSTIEGKFQTKEDGATMKVTDASGASVDGAAAWRDSQNFVFTPTTGLKPSTKYTADITYSCGDSTWSFTTSSTGAVITSSTISGNTYNLNLQSGRFVQPAGVGDLLQQYLTTAVLVGVVSADTSNIQMLGAVAAKDSNPPVQDPCAHTMNFPSADFSQDPYFQVGPKDTTIQVSSYNVTVNNLYISGAFSPDGSTIDGAVLSGTVDTRPLVPLLDKTSTDPNAICSLAASIGVTCVACTDGGPYCLSLYVDSIQATKVAGTTLETDDDPCAKPECASASSCQKSDTGATGS